MDINAPVDSFEKGIVKAYNNCRRKYLRKYIGELDNGQIDVLLRDDYIQPQDILYSCR